LKKGEIKNLQNQKKSVKVDHRDNTTKLLVQFDISVQLEVLPGKLNLWMIFLLYSTVQLK